MAEAKQSAVSTQQSAAPVKHVMVVAQDADTAGRIMQIFDRTAKMLRPPTISLRPLCMTPMKAGTATVEIAQRFALELVKIYPESADFLADQEIFSTLQISRKAVM